MIYKSYLSHHGIKGQKWGVENGPPYPLNDTVKAIAYRGGQLKDGREATNFTLKDVKRARKIVDKNMKLMTEDDLKEYKARLLMESQLRSLVGSDTKEVFANKIKQNMMDAAGASIKQTGTTLMANAEMYAIKQIISSVFGPEVADMLTKDKSNNDKSDKSDKNKAPNIQNKKKENKAKDNEKKDNEKKDDEKNNSRDTKKYETVDGEIIDDKYDNSDNSGSSNNGNYTYYYNPNNTRYESWNSEYLLPGSQETKSSKKSKKSKKRK